ncbi:type II toxin-antitoxin system VapC family toxin [Skermania sp. ID1734]|uniref:type II toxin-antitoxin system VapC family toxin n=1 Tax=Skermania sp. ID1734 TaxID=2597516 RepID=UPI00117CE66E|nr:type II toxin-antitoxin system VapC family toxin [Skermania sp. ID1734]TSE00580.1 type II toxin-antitoxin system VapC family toxin [Skermania sp. ID1734]
MIVDASAILAILLNEPERRRFAEVLTSSTETSMSVVNHLEVAVKVDRHSDPVVPRRFGELIEVWQIQLVPVSLEHARVARRAYRDFGKGSGHPARLNFGDCFAYALATVERKPLLYKGDDFVHTDVRSVL